MVPKSPEIIMKSLRPFLALAVMGVFALTACQDIDPVEPNLQSLSLEDEITLELLQDPASVATALELAGIQSSAAQRRGWRWGSQANPQSQAEHRFREAQAALAQGDQVRAMEQAREGRRLVAQGIEMAGGAQAIVGMVERLESLPVAVAGDPNAFTNAGKLGQQLGQLAVQARKAIRAGNRTQAGALGVLAEQAFRHNHRHQYGVATARAELSVALGAEAVELAQRILNEQAGGADTEQLDLLATAEEFLAGARGALEAGEDGRAIHLAHLAEWWALKAVVLPGGITPEEARFMHDLAQTLLDQARTELGSEPTDLQAALLAKAARMLQNGEANLGNGSCRGMGALWQSAVISSYLLG